MAGVLLSRRVVRAIGLVPVPGWCSRCGEEVLALRPGRLGPPLCIHCLLRIGDDLDRRHPRKSP